MVAGWRVSHTCRKTPYEVATCGIVFGSSTSDSGKSATSGTDGGTCVPRNRSGEVSGGGSGSLWTAFVQTKLEKCLATVAHSELLWSRRYCPLDIRNKTPFLAGKVN